MHSAPAMETGLYAAPSKPRVSKFLAAGVAVVGAGAVAITPVSPIVADDVRSQTHAVALTAAANPTYGSDTSAVYGNLFSESSANFQNLFQAFATDPFPILSQVAANQWAYGTKFLSGFSGVSESFNSWWTGANGKAMIEAGFEHFSNGEFADGWDRLNRSFVYALNIGSPLYSAFWSQAPSQRNPEGNMGIPEQMAINFQQVVSLVFDRNSIVNEMTKTVLGPFLGLGFEVALLADAVTLAMKEGDGEGLVRALVNAPGVMLNTFLNGYVNPECEGSNCEVFPGLINAGGTLISLFSELPKAIAEALKPDPVPGAPWTPPAPSLAAVDSTTMLAARTVTLEIESAAPATETEQAETAPVADEAAPVEDVVAPVEETEEADETAPVTEEAETEAGTEEAATEEDGDAEAPAADESDSDSKDSDDSGDARKSGKPAQAERSSGSSDSSDSGSSSSDSGSSGSDD